MLLRRLALGAASGGRRRLSCTTNTNHKPAPPRTARGARPPAPRVPVGDRRSLVADRPSAIGPGSRSFVRPVEDEDGCAGRCVCMCACVYTCARLPPFNHVIAQSYDITLRARALTTRTLRRAPAASSRVDDEQQPRPTGVQHSAADGRTRRSEQGVTCAADHLSGTFEPRTEGGGALKCGFKQVFVAVAVGRRTMAT